VERLFAGLFQGLDLASVEKDPKTRLQELLQSRRRPLPSYEVTEVLGDQHNQQFHVRCFLDDSGQEANGIGPSRRRAEQDAADKMLRRIAHG